MTKYHKLGGFNNRSTLSHSCGVLEESAGLVPSEAVRGRLSHAFSAAAGVCWQALAFLGLQTYHPNCSLQLHSPQAHICLYVRISFFSNDASHIELGSILVTSC